jgi:polar amino acid transport system substrate-binding protein
MRFADGLLVAALLMTGNAMADDSILEELAPTGKLRVAIAVGPSPSALFTVRDAASGQPRGVAVDLGTALAKKLGVPVEFIQYQASGEITDAADKGEWDVSFMPVDDERAKRVAFGPAYHLLQSTYLVAPGSRSKTWSRLIAPVFASPALTTPSPFGRPIASQKMQCMSASLRPPKRSN